MASSSPVQFLLDTVVDALQSEPEFSVIRVWKSDAYESSRVTVYPYIASVVYANDLEDASATGLSTANVEVVCQCIVESDPSGLGIAQERASMIAMLVKHALESYDLETLESNQDLYYTTNIIGMTVDGNTGTFNVNDNRIQLGVACTIYFATA